jgi:hypothetical protein
MLRRALAPNVQDWLVNYVVRKNPQGSTRSCAGNSSRRPGTAERCLAELESARRNDADTAEAAYAADGHPVRIVLDREENAVDDEARYVITAYERAKSRRAGDLTDPRPGT